MTELWINAICADGGEASPEQQRKAWAGWLRFRHGATAWDLVCLLHLAGVEAGTGKWSCAHRIADRMLQRARKAGLIRYQNGKWEFVE